MEAQTDIQTYLEQGKQALAHGQGREAAIAYAHAAQLDPGNPLVHLGLAEANLALGSTGVVQMACQRTQELAPGSSMANLAQALVDLLDRRYEQALRQADAVVQDDPGNAYAHALRAYLLSATNQTYDAGLARSRASRLSFGGKFENCFPPVEPLYTGGYQGRPADFAAPAPAPNAEPEVMQPMQPRQREQVSAWSQPGTMQRQMIRTRFWMSQNPRFVTNILIALNVLAYLLVALISHEFVDFTDPAGVNALVNMGAQINVLVAQGQFWRIFTSMFLHVSFIQLALDMFSLFFVGTVIEVFYGKWRYLVIYLLSGIVSGAISYVLSPTGYAIGAYGAIFGIFGAIGAFYIINRRSLGGMGSAMIGQWVFWLLLNLAFGFANGGAGLPAQLGGLVAGIVLGLLLLPPQRRVGRRI